MLCAQEGRQLKATFLQRCDAIKCLEVRFDEEVSLVTPPNDLTVNLRDDIERKLFLLHVYRSRCS